MDKLSLFHKLKVQYKKFNIYCLNDHLCEKTYFFLLFANLRGADQPAHPIVCRDRNIYHNLEIPTCDFIYRGIPGLDPVLSIRQ